MRTGNPCSSGSGSPFISTASIASRPSITTAVGLPTVNPSTERETSWSAAGSTPASSSKGFSGTPTQRALPMYGPPTSFETHVSVMSRSISSRATSCSKSRVISRSTMPWIRSVQSSARTAGTSRAVSTR